MSHVLALVSFRAVDGVFQQVIATSRIAERAKPACARRVLALVSRRGILCEVLDKDCKQIFEDAYLL